MARSINRNDPAYHEAMKEAKALFDAAMQKSAMKGRGRPAAPRPVVEDPVASDAELTAEIEAEATALADGAEAPEAPATPAAAAAPAPAAERAPAKKPRAPRRKKEQG